MKVKIFNQAGEIIDNTDFSNYTKNFNHELVHQVVIAMQANRRQANAHAKIRSEKRGGGKKPWRQKGTGRARHGSIRSPLWRGGGVTFGPRNTRNFNKKINKKMKQKALTQVLSAKARDKEIIIFDKLNLNKTKDATALLNKLKIKSALLLNIKPRAFNNLPRIKGAPSLNILDLLNYKYLITEKKWLEK